MSARCKISTENGQAVAGYLTDSAAGLIGQFPLDGEGAAKLLTDDSGYLYNGPGLVAADEVLHARGYQRIAEWEEDERGDWSAEIAPDDPPEYDPYDDAADQAEEWAAGQRELAEIEAEEAHDAAGEAWQEAAYQPGVSDPAETSGPRRLA